jgi:tetratricopeptide (TPR) repeat protein
MLKKKLIILIISISFLFSCKKFLDAKPDLALVTPNKVEDLQRLLDNSDNMNTAFGTAGESSADNLYLNYIDWSGMNDGGRNMYTWGPEIFFDQFPNEWAQYYLVVYYANNVLESLSHIQRTAQNESAWDNVKGSACIYRAMAFSRLVSLFSPAYNITTSASDPGIPLRLNSDFNEISVRSSVQQSYDRVIADLSRALKYLPVTPQHKMRPSKPAAYALLAKTYLAMGNFDKAGLYADSCLRLYNTLIDFNTLTAAAAFPLALFNDEVIWNIVSRLSSPVSKAIVDSSLYRSYSANDCRQQVFFKNNNNGTFGFKGNYTGSTMAFSGIAADEVWLIRAECFARANNIVDAMSDLNTVMKKRWKTNLFVPFTAATPQEALNSILTERRKELLFRDIRFADIKRLNRQGLDITITRKLNGEIFQLPPNDNRYALPLPQQVIDMTGMPQNPR